MPVVCYFKVIWSRPYEDTTALHYFILALTGSTKISPLNSLKRMYDLKKNTAKLDLVKSLVSTKVKSLVRLEFDVLRQTTSSRS